MRRLWRPPTSSYKLRSVCLIVSASRLAARGCAALFVASNSKPAERSAVLAALAPGGARSMRDSRARGRRGGGGAGTVAGTVRVSAQANDNRSTGALRVTNFGVHPATVVVSVRKKFEQTKQILKTQVKLKRRHQEETAFRFRLTSDGDLVKNSVTTLRRRLITEPM